MKSTTSNREHNIMGGNLAIMDKMLASVKLQPEQAGILRLVADLFDTIESGKNVYMVIGSTQSGSAYTLSVKGDVTAPTLFAAQIEEMNQLANDLV